MENQIQNLTATLSIEQIICGDCFLIYGLIIQVSVICLYFLKKYMGGPSYDSSDFDLTGQYAVVTGGNSGIGKETVLELIRLNCNVIIGARDKRKSEQVVKQAKQIISAKKQKCPQIIEHAYLDLGSKKSIQQFSKIVSQRFPKIDYLVNNAGLSLMSKKNLTEDGFQMHYGVNHLGHFYLTSLLINKLKRSNFFRIINVSSMAHKKLLGFGPRPILDWQNMNFEKENSYEHNLAYSRSKLCNVLFTKALSTRIDQSKGLVLAVHPGVVQTQIFRHQKFLWTIVKLIMPLFNLFTKNSKEGAQTTIFALLDKNVESGQYYADCQKSSINEFAQDQKNQEKLWEISQKQLQIQFDLFC